MNFNDFFNELKRRNVFKGTISYLIFSWVLLQVVTILTPILNAPAWFGKMMLILLIAVLPVWVTVSWFFEVTTEGIKKTKNVPADKSITKKTGQKFNAFIIVFLTLAIVLLFVDRFRIKAKSDKTDSIAEVIGSTAKSIAVLPFRDMSLNKNQEYFADGLAEELLNSLAKIPELQVTSRTSAFSFKGKELGIPEMAAKLNVNYILEGSVRTFDSLIRISVKLVETKDDNNIWSQQWDKELKNIFQIQNEISEAVAENLQLRILDGVVPKVKEAKTEAYALYLQARYQYQNSNGDDRLLSVEDQLEKVISIDSTYAPAWALLGKIYHAQNNYGLIDATEGYRLSKNALIRAIEEDSTYAETYSTLATISLDYEKDIRQAEKWANKGLKMQPNNPNVIDSASEIALLRGKSEEAISLNKKSIILDPVDASNYYMLANTYYFAEQYENAIENIKEAIRLNPDSDVVYATYAMSLLQLQRYDEALEIIEKEHLEGFRLHIKAIIYHHLGKFDASQKELNQIIDHHQKSYSYQVAVTYGALGDKDKMYEWLEKARENHDMGLSELTVEPIFKSYKQEERWRKFIEKLDFKY